MAKLLEFQFVEWAPNARNCRVCGRYVGPHQMYCKKGHFAGY